MPAWNSSNFNGTISKNPRTIIETQEIVKRNKDLEQIIHMLRVYTKKQLGFMCESWVINIKNCNISTYLYKGYKSC